MVSPPLRFRIVLENNQNNNGNKRRLWQQCSVPKWRSTLLSCKWGSPGLTSLLLVRIVPPARCLSSHSNLHTNYTGSRAPTRGPEIDTRIRHSRTYTDLLSPVLRIDTGSSTHHWHQPLLQLAHGSRFKPIIPDLIVLLFAKWVADVRPVTIFPSYTYYNYWHTCVQHNSLVSAADFIIRAKKI